MELFNTLIIDTDHPENRLAFISLVKDNPFIVFVAIGNSNTVKDLVEKADLLADDHQGKIARRVVWIQDSAIFQEDCLAFLKAYPETFEETVYPKVMAFTLSPVWSETKYIFMKDDPTDDVDVSFAYWKASLRERAVDPDATT